MRKINFMTEICKLFILRMWVISYELFLESNQGNSKCTKEQFFKVQNWLEGCLLLKIVQISKISCQSTKQIKYISSLEMDQRISTKIWPVWKFLLENYWTIWSWGKKSSCFETTKIIPNLLTSKNQYPLRGKFLT